MRHQRVVKKFGRSTEHRKMLMRSLVTNLILAESIKTTLPKAKEARKDADKMVTIAKKGDLAARRLAASRLTEPKAVQKLFAEIAPYFAEAQLIVGLMGKAVDLTDDRLEKISNGDTGNDKSDFALDA
jgi:large subunit ribosomal protein L17